MSPRRDVRALAERVLRLEAEAILGVIPTLDERFERAVELLHTCSGRVIVTGIGKSGLIGRKIAATLSSTGTPAFFLHPAEGVHGDLGMLARGDVVLALSNSGETDEMLAILPPLKRLGMTTVVDAEGRLAGVITDGDLRRLHMRGSPFDTLNAGEVATRAPRTIGADDLAAKALEVMEGKITSLVVVDETQRPRGVVHLHDILRAKIV